MTHRADFGKPTQAEWKAVHPKLRKGSGGELVGPCPVCKQGDDRFAVKPDGTWNLRACGCAGTGKGQDYFDFLRNSGHDKKFWQSDCDAFMDELGGSSKPQPRREIRRHAWQVNGKTVQHIKFSDGKWTWNPSGAMKGNIILYREWESLLDAGTIYVTEGEKDALSLVEQGLSATCTHSPNAWPEAMASKLSGKHVIIVPDNDVAGKKQATKAGQAISRAGAASVRVIQFKTAKDVAELLDNINPAERKTRIQELSNAAIPFTQWAQHETGQPDSEPNPFIEPAGDQGTKTDAFGNEVCPMSDFFIEMQHVSEPILTTRYLVKKWIDLGSLSLLYGPSGCGKTHFLLNMMAHVGAAQEWRGHRVTSGRVLYIAAEGGVEAITNRMIAIKKEFPELDDANLTVYPKVVNLMDPKALGALVDTLKDDPPVALVIDTLARNSPGAKESEAGDMGLIIASLDFLREKLETAVIVCHHSGKDFDRGARGSSALRAAVDIEIAVNEEKCVKVTKSRNQEAPNPVFYEIKSVHLGWDDDNDQVTAGIAIPVEVSPAKVAADEALQDKVECALAALDDALDTYGIPSPGGAKMPKNCQVVSIKDWLSVCLETPEFCPTRTQKGQDEFFRKLRRHMEDCPTGAIFKSVGRYAWKVKQKQ